MKLIIVRHAVALDKEIAAKRKLPDSQRPLTEKGKEDFKKFIELQAHLFKKPAVLMSSPYLRALETADILQKKIYKKNTVKIISDVLPESDPEKFVEFLKKAKFSAMVVCTHEPFMSALLGSLLKCQLPNMKIKKGCIAVVSFNEKAAELLQLSNP